MTDNERSIREIALKTLYDIRVEKGGGVRPHFDETSVEEDNFDFEGWIQAIEDLELDGLVEAKIGAGRSDAIVHLTPRGARYCRNEYDWAEPL